MKTLVTTMVGALMLVQAAPALGQETTPVEWGTKPIVRSLRARQTPRTLPTISSEALARWEAAQTKPAVRPLLAERERRARSIQVAPESSSAVARCMGTKPVTWALGHCGEERTEEGAASSRP